MSDQNISVTAIVPAAGSGKRMGLGQPKQYHHLAGRPILIHTVQVCYDSSSIAEIIVVVPKDKVVETEQLLAEYKLDDQSVTVVAGGRRRQDSVLAGLQHMDSNSQYVLVHDGARPLVTEEIIQRCVQGAVLNGAAIAAVPVKDTLKRSEADGCIRETVDRQGLWQAQTPQVVRRDLLQQAYDAAAGKDVTDEASLLEMAGIPVKLVEGSETNIKITRPDDLIIAEKIMQQESNKLPRIGHGYDAHQFTPDKPLVLGGVTIPYKNGLAGHSDADVLTHALCDALLGAVGEGDIGRHFPDNDDQFKDIYSILLLEQVMASVRQKDYVLGNCDITLICQEPRIAPHLESMCSILADACCCQKEDLNIKATTTEKMGFTGRLEGISCHAVVFLVPKN